MKYVGYYRVSTKQQGKSGLGLEAQRLVVEEFAGGNGSLINTYVDIESGGKNDRCGVLAALKEAKKEGAVLLIARLDRFSRKVSFISWVMEQGVDLCVVEMPNASTFQLHIHAACAEEERRLASLRTKAALAAARERGVELGVMGKVRAKENAENALEFALETLGALKNGFGMGKGYSDMARTLNGVGVKSYRGKKFYPATVRNMVRYIVDGERCME